MAYSYSRLHIFHILDFRLASKGHTHSLLHYKPLRLPAHLQPPHISPHCEMTTSRFGTSLPLYPVLVFSILRTTSMPSATLPNTTCLPSRKGVGTVVMKNWEPLPLGPAFCLVLFFVDRGGVGKDKKRRGDLQPWIGGRVRCALW